MREGHKEFVGFLSRWCLLATASLSVLAVGWSLVGAASSVLDAVGRKVVLSDGIWWPWRRPYVTGYILPLRRRGRYARFLAVSSPGERLIVCGGRRSTSPPVGGDLERLRVELSQPGPPEVIRHLRIKGNPYGRYAFASDEAICKLIGPGRRVVAIDARFVLASPDERQGAFRECIKLLTRHAEVAFFWPGEVGEYQASRRRIRQLYPTTPVVFAAGAKPSALDGLRHIAWTIYGRRRIKPVVVTGEGELARAAAEAGFPVHCISRGQAKPAGPGEPTYYDTVTQFRSALYEPWQPRRRHPGSSRPSGASSREAR